MNSNLRTVLLLSAACLALGCHIPSYVIEVNVTAPLDVQRAFSASEPGFVMDGNLILGVLCAPKSEPEVFHIELFKDHARCLDRKAFEDQVNGTAYAFRPTEAELQRLDARERNILACGQTAPVTDQGARDAISIMDPYDNVEPARRIAVGSSKGDCISGRYVVDITLALK